MMNNLNSFDMLKLLGFRDNIFIGKLFMYGVTELMDNGKCCPSITKTGPFRFPATFTNINIQYKY